MITHFGFIVSKCSRSRAIDFTPVYRRICVLRMKGKFKNCIFICAHAPMEERSERENNQFDEQLERMYKICPSYDIKIILGDMNAKMRKEILAGIAFSTCGLHERNDNRTHLINYAVCQHMVTVEILFSY
jgi:hypothetical protein